MSEDNEPDPSAQPATGSERRADQNVLLIRQTESFLQAHEAMRRQMEPVVQAHEFLRRQFEPILLAHEALRRQMEPLLQTHEMFRRLGESIAQAMEQFACIASWPRINIGPALPYTLRLANAMDAQMRELLSPGPAAHQISATLNANVAITATAEVAAAQGFALSPTVLVPGGDVATASESASVDVIDLRRRGLVGLGDGQILALVLVWLLVLVIPAAAWDANLKPEIQALVDAYDGILANVAVAITFDILGKRKKR